MSQNLTISDTGLKLIKAFEGYRPVDRELISGQRIVGYGHRLYSEDAVAMNKGEAETILRADLEPFEDMINSEVHAPISQSQFDALCSFAFNIGPKAFLTSDTLRALNNGRPLDAANGLDVWRKSEIAGKTYVVDALMRRRTAEKALFLRTDRNLPAGREDLPPVQDTTLAGLSTEDALPVFTDNDINGIVATVPFEARNMPARRREDGPAGALQLSELDVIEGDDVLVDEIQADLALEYKIKDIEQAETALDVVSPDLPDTLDTLDTVEEDDITPERTSPIAAAATDIVARLDALIDDADARFDDPDTDWPESLIKSEVQDEAVETLDDEVTAETVEQPNRTNQANVIDLNTRTSRPTVIVDETPKKTVSDKPKEASRPSKTTKPIMVIDELAQDDAFRMRTDSAAKYIETSEPILPAKTSGKASTVGLWVLVLLGFILAGLAAGAMVRGSEALMGAWGPIIAFTGFVIGLGLILAGVYAALRMNLRD